MSRYLRPDLLLTAGVEDFDSWAASFGQTVTEIEVDPGRTGDYRMHTRFARFQNVPEMLRLWAVFADVKTAEDLALPVPELARRPDGQRAPIAQLIAASPELTGYVQQLSERAENVRGRIVDPTEDNMLKITGDGRKAALDMQLVTGQPASAPGKLQAAAANIARLYHATRAREYRDPVTGRIERLLLGRGAGPLNEPAACVPCSRLYRHPAVRSVPLEVIGDEGGADPPGAAGADLLHQPGMKAAPEIAAGGRVAKPPAVLAVGGRRDKRREVAVLGASPYL